MGTQWKVVRREFEAQESTVRLWTEDTPLLRSGESSGAKEAVTAHVHTEELVWRHSSVLEHHCEIRCLLPRG